MNIKTQTSIAMLFASAMVLAGCSDDEAFYTAQKSDELFTAADTDQNAQEKTGFTVEEAGKYTAAALDYVEENLQRDIASGNISEGQADKIREAASNLAENPTEELLTRLWDSQGVASEWVWDTVAQNHNSAQANQDFLETLSPSLKIKWATYNYAMSSSDNEGCYLDSIDMYELKDTVLKLACKDDKVTVLTVAENAHGFSKTYDFEDGMAFYSNERAASFKDLNSDRLSDLYNLKGTLEQAIEDNYREYADYMARRMPEIMDEIEHGEADITTPAAAAQSSSKTLRP